MVAVHVGSFAKQAGTGNQDVTLPADVVTAMNAGPYAIKFWTVGSTAASSTWLGTPYLSLGFVGKDSGGTITQYAVGASMWDNQATSDTARRMASACITQPNTDAASVLFEAQFVGTQGAAAMRLNWTSNSAYDEQIMYMIITGLTGAKVVNWTTPTTAINKAVTGVGFNPDLVLHAAAHVSAAIPETAADAALGFGAMNKHGQQWANSFRSLDGEGTPNSSRFQQTDACIALTNASEVANLGQAHFVSMDADGFTTNFSTAYASLAHYIISLCMDGISSKLGAFTVPSVSGAQEVRTDHGFTARGALLSSFGGAPSADPQSSAMWSLGATDGTNQRSVLLQDVDAPGDSNTHADSLWWNNKILGMGDNTSGASPVLWRSMSWTSSDLDSFTVYNDQSIAWPDEVLYLLVGDAGTDTFPADVGGSVGGFLPGAASTAYSNQKKIANLSTGRRVVPVPNPSGALNCYFRYSDDGQTWAWLGDGVGGSQLIAGWSNGSIDSYVDSGGTERLVAVWKQSGTGGGRTDGYLYAMVGTFNAGRTTLTWGAAVALNLGDSLGDYPDVVAHAEGTGGAAHAVFAYGHASTVSQTYWRPYSIDSSGVPTPGSNLLIGGSYGTAIATFPSIDYNPADKRLHVAWSAGTTGAGKGIRYNTASYSGGTWTWAAEVEVVTDVYVANEIYGVVCRWDGTRAVIGGQLYTGAANRIRVYDSTSFTAFTERVTHSHGDSDALYGFGMAIDAGTGDVYLFGSPYSGSNMRDVWYRKATRSGSTLTLGSAVIIDAFIGGNSGNPPRVNANAYSGGIELIYTHGNNAPYAVKYDRIQTNVAPLAATHVAPANASVQNLAAGFEFDWNFNDSPGDTQSAWAMRRKISGAGAYEYWNVATGAWQSTVVWNASVSTAHTFAASKWTNGNVYNWAVNTKDSLGVEGTWPSDWTVTADTPATVTVTAPAGTVTTTSRPTVTWSLSDPEGNPQQTYRVKIFTAAQYGIGGFDPATSPNTWDSGETTSVLDRARQVGIELTDDTTYRAYVQVKTGNQYSLWVYSGFTLDLTPPSAPTIARTLDDANGRVLVTVTGTHSEVTFPSTAFRVEYSDDAGGTWATLRNASALVPAPVTLVATVYDYEATNAIARQYRAKTIATV